MWQVLLAVSRRIWCASLTIPTAVTHAGRASRLYICEWCLKYMMSPRTLELHDCQQRTPPGKEIYRKGVKYFHILSHLTTLQGRWRCLSSTAPNTSCIARTCACSPRSIQPIHHMSLTAGVAGVFGPQDTVLRCGAVSVLRRHRSRPVRLPLCRVLLQGTIFIFHTHNHHTTLTAPTLTTPTTSTTHTHTPLTTPTTLTLTLETGERVAGGQQSCVHHDTAAVPAQRLRPLPHRIQYLYDPINVN